MFHLSIITPSLNVHWPVIQGERDFVLWIYWDLICNRPIPSFSSQMFLGSLYACTVGWGYLASML